MSRVTRRTTRAAILLLAAAAASAVAAASPLDAIVRHDLEPIDAGDGPALHRVLELDLGADRLVLTRREHAPDAARLVEVNGTPLDYDAEALAEYERLLERLRFGRPDEIDRGAVAPRLTLLDERLRGNLIAPEEAGERLRALSLALWAGLAEEPAGDCWREAAYMAAAGMVTAGSCIPRDFRCPESIAVFAMTIHDLLVCLDPEDPPGTTPGDGAEECGEGESPCRDGCCPDPPEGPA